MGEGTVTRPPLRRRRIIERPRLTRLLDESQGRIKMLIAPAGYGKTTLARQWLEGRPAAWFTATPAARDVAALAAEASRSISSVAPASANTLMERLTIAAQEEPAPEGLAELLAADTQEWPASAWLVIDDYHVLAGAASSERFLTALINSLDLNVFLMSRTRPDWATARRVMYGEIVVLERATLAMTDDEALLMLDRQPRASSDLIQLAQGWPAVLALGDIAGALPHDAESKSRLHDFFAGEIYQRFDDPVKLALCELSLYDTASRAAGVGTLSHDLANAVISAAGESGFLVELPGQRLEMHPLVRDFLGVRLLLDWRDKVEPIVRRVTETLMELESWDEAFDLIVRHGQTSLLPVLLARSMQGLLAAGRTATLRRWIEHAPQGEPAVQVAAAELAFRDGRFHESEALATMSARGETGEHAAQALLVAGRAAHAASREREAAKHYAEAERLATSDVTRRRATHGALSVAIELESPDASSLLESLGPIDYLDPSERAIYTSRKINLESRLALPVSIDEARATWQLLGRVSDPMLRATFRNVLGYSLAAMGYAQEALAITEELLEDARRCHLSFVIPYALTNRAIVHLLAHEYRQAEEALDDAESRALTAGDQTAYHIAWCVRTRLNNAQGSFDQAVSRPIPRECGQTDSLEAELLASYAVAFACLGDLAAAQEYVDRSREMSRAVEVAILAPAAEAVCWLRQGDNARALELGKTALDVTASSGMIESFVSAYRACPEILVHLHRIPAAHADIRRIVTTAGDAGTMLAKREGRYSILELSPREKEVLALLSQGLSNIDIGDQLFISPVTVKVHVRHIFEKLGVSSRAEAALRAARLSRD